jgi:manganese transport protein
MSGDHVYDAGRLPSLPGSYRSVAIARRPGFWPKLGAFAGPGWLVAVGYIDPGNWATDIAAGSRFAYGLLSVVVLSSLLAMLLQTLALRLGIASGYDLAQACRARYKRPVALGLWVSAEIAIIACDLAEVIGAAVALNLLFGIPLFVGACITAVDVLLILQLQQRGMRYFEALIVVLVGTTAACFAVELMLSSPALGDVLGGLIPSPRIVVDRSALYIAIGILGATVMPHNLYLHSAVAQSRRYDLTLAGKREAARFATIDCIAALTVALFINGAILVLAASTFHATGHTDVADIQEAHRLLAPVLGTGLAGVVFAIGLLASGQSSSLTGTLAGQIVADGFLRWRMPLAARRLITRAIAIAPVLVVLAVVGEHPMARLLVLSQVILSMQLAFAVVPLVTCTSDRAWMGALVSPPWLRVAGWGAAGLVIAANAWLLWLTCIADG